ncbi:MAG: CDGSH iron-sulfur domain-containing protein, partial [Pseudomonadota bacterium]
GDYLWCACGRSKNQPFCDNSHGTSCVPVKFSLTEPTEVWLCGCKTSSNKPFCDGSHKHCSPGYCMPDDSSFSDK